MKRWVHIIKSPGLMAATIPRNFKGFSFTRFARLGWFAVNMIEVCVRITHRVKNAILSSTAMDDGQGVKIPASTFQPTPYYIYSRGANRPALVYLVGLRL
jgi:hypothetical protein